MFECFEKGINQIMSFIKVYFFFLNFLQFLISIKRVLSTLPPLFFLLLKAIEEELKAKKKNWYVLFRLKCKVCCKVIEKELFLNLIFIEMKFCFFLKQIQLFKDRC